MPNGPRILTLQEFQREIFGKDKEEVRALSWRVKKLYYQYLKGTRQWKGY